MDENERMSRSSSYFVHVKDCLVASAVMAVVYFATGDTGLVVLVFGFSVGVVVFLLLLEAYSHFDFEDDDFWR